MAAAKNPTAERLFLADDLSRVMEPLGELKLVLERHKYEATGVLPLPGRLHHLPLDGANLVQFLRGRQNLFHKSALAGLFRALLRLR
jgi:hypothetical protein